MPATTINDYQESEFSHPPPTKCGTCCKFIRKVLSFLLSHIGLLSLVVGYCIMGAFIFEELEHQNELEVKRNMTKNRHMVTEDLWEITRSMEVLKQENWTEEVTGRLRSFEKSLIIALKEKGWDGKESEDTVTWSFAGALFYSITVITTIGYGHIAPKTAISKIVTIFYAILGIPLTVLCWSNIGDAMANAFRFCYWRICCYVCTKKPKKKKKRMARNRMSMRQPTIRSRSVRRSIRTQRSADTISDSINSYSVSDADRYYEEGTAEPFQRNKPTRRSLPRSLHIQQQQQQQQQPIEDQQSGIKEDLTNRNSGESQTVAKENLQTGNGEHKVPEKKFSTAARVARGLGLKKTEKEGQKMPNGDSSQAKQSMSLPPASVNPPATTPTSTLAAPGYQAGGAPPILVTNKVAKTPPGIPAGGVIQNQVVGSPQTPPGQMDNRSAMYRLDRVPEDEWTMMEQDSYYYDDYASEDEMEDYSTKPVPIWLSICLVIGYIVGGAFLFQEWEGWSMLDSSYFCFITLTTIGFGDLTPDQKNTDGEIRIALCSMYLLFGIAMIAMSFNLVQEEVINNVKGMAKQLGIIKDDDEEEEDY